MYSCLPAIAVALCLVLPRGFLHNSAANMNLAAPPTISAQPQKSIAVLPFLDLTQGMKEEEFADGMTEELIDKLAKVPGLRVPPPTSSFVYKGNRFRSATSLGPSASPTSSMARAQRRHIGSHRHAPGARR
jgi:hypothetical protein